MRHDFWGKLHLENLMAGLKPRFFFGFSFPSAEADGKVKQSNAMQSKAP